MSTQAANPENLAVIVEIASSAGLFLCFWLLLEKRFIRPYLSLLLEREERTAGDALRARELESERQVLDEKISALLRKTRLEAMSLRDERVRKAKHQAGVLLEQAAELSREKRKNTLAEIEKKKQEARLSLPEQAETLASVVAERALAGTSERLMH